VVVVANKVQTPKWVEYLQTYKLNFGILDARFLNLTAKKAWIKTHKIHRILFQINQLVVFQRPLNSLNFILNKTN
jgi:hypothetical protein